MIYLHLSASDENMTNQVSPSCPIPSEQPPAFSSQDAPPPVSSPACAGDTVPEREFHRKIFHWHNFFIEDLQ
jgi:hypothetical protein